MRSKDPESKARTGAVVSSFAGASAGVIAGLVAEDLLVAVTVGLPLALLALWLELRATIFQVQGDVSRAVGLQRRLDRSPFLEDAVEELTATYESVLRRPSNDRAFHNKARQVVEACVRDLRRLDAGELWVLRARGMKELMARFAAPDLRHVVAVSKGPVWEGQVGRNYNELNIKRAAEGVQIVRIFLEEDLAKIPPSTFDAIRSQAEAGIEVWLALKSEIPEELHHGFAIFDRTYFVSLDKVDPVSRSHRVFEEGPDAPPSHDLDWTITVSKEETRRDEACEDFETIKVASKRVDDEWLRDADVTSSPPASR